MRPYKRDYTQRGRSFNLGEPTKQKLMSTTNPDLPPESKVKLQQVLITHSYCFAASSKDLEFSAKSNPLQIKGVSDQPEAITTKLLEARKIVHQKLHQIHLRQKSRYDEQRREAQYAENDFVLVYKPLRKIRKSEKLLHRWLGPYKIIRRTSDLNYEVQKVKSRNNVTDIVHVMNLKPFNPPR